MEEEREELRAETSGDFQRETRDNGTQVFREIYSEGAIKRLRHLIKTSWSEGNKKFYSILIDGEKVVEKTSDVRKFDSYAKYLNPFTKVVTVLMYKGYSFNNNRYEFTVSHGLSGALGGQSQEERFQKMVADYKKEQEFKALKLELKKKTKKLKELKVMIEQVESEDEKESDFGFAKVSGMVNQALGIVHQIKGGAPPALGNAPASQLQEEEVIIEAVEEEEEKPKKKKKKTEEEQLFGVLFKNQGAEQIIRMTNFMQKMSEHPDLNAKFQKELNNKSKEEL